MAAYWTIEYDGDEKTPEQWGVKNLHRDCQNQGEDSFGFDEVAPFDSAARFPYNAEIILRKNGVKWFVGRRVENPRTGSPDIETLEYYFVGPWSYLERIVFQQSKKSWNGEALEDVYNGNCNLGQKADGTFQTNGETIVEILTYVRARMLEQYGSYKLAIGTGFPQAQMPCEQRNTVTAAEAIRLCLGVTPDAIIWFDYSTDVPTLNCKVRSAQSLVTLPLADGESHQSTRITSREDLVMNAVHFIYNRPLDGYIQTFHDIACAAGSTDPNTGVTTPELYLEARKFDVAVQTFDLQGLSVSRQSAEVETQDIDTTSLSWWKERLPDLGATNYEVISIKANSVTREKPNGSEVVNPTLPRLLKPKSNLAKWMEGVVSEHQVIRAKIFLRVYDKPLADGTKKITRDYSTNPIDVHTELTATNAVTQTYVSTSVQTSPEELPFGLAQQYYQAVSQRHFQGTHTIVEQEITDVAPVGKLLNLAFMPPTANRPAIGRAEWATMNAQIQSVSYDIDRSRTTITIGPARHLGAGDLIDLCRLARSRRAQGSLTTRTSGRVSADIDMGNSSPVKTGAVGAGVSKRLQLGEYDPATGLAKTNFIDMNTDDLKAKGTPAADRALSIREINVCKDGDNTWKMLVLGSVEYK